MRGLLKARARRCGALACNSYCLEVQNRAWATLGPASDQAFDRATTALSVNGHRVEVPNGTTILEACRALKIHVPTLCNHPRLPTHPGTCRLCLVDVDGRLQPACATPVREGACVTTDTAEVQQNIRSILTLLKANHPDDCMKCEVNGRCEFQDLITRYHIASGLPKLRDFSHEWDDEMQEESAHYHDSSSHALTLDLEKCLKCGRCVTACGSIQKMKVLGMFNRGRHRHPGLLAESPLDFSKCIECGQCASVCPTGAIQERSEWREVLDILEAGRKVVVCQTAPAVRVAIGEEVGLAPGSITTGQIVAAQRALGFKYVFDTNFAADLTIMEEATELLHRLTYAWQQADAAGAEHVKAGQGEGGVVAAGEPSPGPLPMFTSCCPAWINLVQKSYPELLPHLSSCKSPQMMLGAVVKQLWAQKAGVDPEQVVLVSVMPCTAKKHEADMPKFVGPGGVRDVDYVLTTREFGRMLRHKRIPLASLPEQAFDSPLGQSSGAAELFGATGGVMEAAVRTAYEWATGTRLPPDFKLMAARGLAGVKEAELSLPLKDGSQKQLRIAIASGVGNARALLQGMMEGTAGPYHFIEVMACPGGCIGGGGQPKSHDPMVVLKRMSSIYAIDEKAVVRQSNDNEEIQELYKAGLGEPGGSKAHQLLHTHYEDEHLRTLPPYTVPELLAARTPLEHAGSSEPKPG